MVNGIASFFIASVFGMLAGMGVGGGSLLLLWLTQVVDMAQPQARIINLLFYLPAAIISTLYRKKQNALPAKAILPGILAGCAAAALFTYIGADAEITLLKKLLGGLLIVTGIREICYRPRNAK